MQVKYLKRILAAIDSDKPADYQQLYSALKKFIYKRRQFDPIRNQFTVRHINFQPQRQIRDNLEAYQTADQSSQNLTQCFKRYLCQRVTTKCNEKCPHILDRSDDQLLQFAKIWTKYGVTNPQQIYQFFKYLKLEHKILKLYSFKQIMGCIIYNFEKLYLCSFAPISIDQVQKKYYDFYQRWRRAKLNKDEKVIRAEKTSIFVEDLINCFIGKYYNELKIENMTQLIVLSFLGVFGWEHYSLTEFQLFSYAVVICAFMLKFNYTKPIKRCITLISMKRRFDLDYTNKMICLMMTYIAEGLKQSNDHDLIEKYPILKKATQTRNRELLNQKKNRKTKSSSKNISQQPQ